MGDLCLDGEITENPLSSNQIGHVVNDYSRVEENIYQGRHVVHVDAVTNTGFLIDSFGLHSSLGDIFSYLWTLTAYISHQFVDFIEDLVFHDIEEYSNNLAPGYLRPFSRSSDHGICKSYFEGYSSSSNSSPGFCGRKPQDKRKELSVNTRHAVRNSSYCHGATYFIIRGLMLPLFGLRLAWNLALACSRCSFYYIRCTQIQVRSIASRVYKTLHGSSGDIGWLQHTPGMDPVEDGTPRFIELLTKIRNGEHTLPDSYVYLLIPGLFSNHSPLYFVGTKKFFSKMGLACHIAIIHSEASVQQNAWELKQYIEELYWGSGKQVILLGHSKGGVDAAAALSIYWCDLKDKVAGLALVQSPYGGTPLASDILREGQIADKETRRIMELLICKLINGDIRALEDLTYERRREFIMNHRLPKEIPLISFHSEASVGPGVLATMTHIAQAELPWLPLPKFGSEEYDSVLQAGRQVPVVIPLSAAMAVCALHLQLRYGEKSDGLVTCRDAEVPGSVVVRPDKKLDHAWMVYSSRKRDSSEPESFEMCEALLTMLVELGKIKQEKGMHT